MLALIRSRSACSAVLLWIWAISTALLMPAVSHAADKAGQPRPGITYEYPEQPGRDTLREGDPDRQLLSDGSDAPAVWGQWDVKPFIVDWTFDEPVRVRAIELTIEHPVDPQTGTTHPHQVHLFVGGPEGQFPDDPAVTLPIPFEPGNRQKVTLTVPDEGLIAKRLRTHFEGSNRQTVIGEIAFHTEPATWEQLRAAWKAADEARPTPLKPVKFRPVGLLKDVPPPPKDSIFGAAGHMLHTDHFYPGHFSEYWRLEYTLPFVQQLGISSVREPIYQAYFSSDMQANRQLVEEYLALYDRAGVNVVICAIFSNSGEEGTPGAPDLGSFCHWIAGLAKKYPCVEAVELGNEPNLTPFWSHTYKEYVETARQAAKLIREVAPDVPIVVGSFSGMGGAWMRPELLAEAGDDEADQAVYWARKCFEAGMLEFADGVSLHPYPESNTQPEGGIFLYPRTDPDGYEKELRAFWEMAQAYNTTNRPLKLYFTELGYEITSTRTPQQQADYLSRLMLILFNSRVSGSIPLARVHWYDLKEDDPVVGASGWGLVAQNTSHVRPAYVAYQRIAHAFGKTEDFEALDIGATFSNWPHAIKHYVWQRKSDGAVIVAFWRMEQLQKRDVDFDSELTLPLPGSWGMPSRVEWVDLHADRPQPIGFEAAQGELRTAVRVTDRAAWLVIHP